MTIEPAYGQHPSGPAGPDAVTAPVRPKVSTRAAQVAVAVADVAVLFSVVGSVALAPTHWWLWAYVGFVMACLVGSGQYRHRITLSVSSHGRALAAVVGIPLLLMAAAHVGGASSAALLTAAAVAIVSMLIVRAMNYAVIRKLRSRGVLARRTLIVGAGVIGHQLASTLEEHPEYGLCPVGFVDDVDASGLALPLFGGVDLLRMVLSEDHIEHVIVAFGVAREQSMIDIFRACQEASADVHVLPRFFELAATANGRDVDNVWGFPLVHLRRSALRSHAWTIKRTLDMSVALFGLAVLSPLYGLIALAVKLTSRGPVHFRQERVGQRGTIVKVLKFRSMRVHDGSDTEWKAADSVTSIGKILRKTGLDEMPQLWNVVRGDMSIVGPRPERPFFVDQFKTEIPHYDDRHRVPVGLTGLAQIHGLRGDTPIQERARFDNHYIENWSFMGDVRIMFQTFGAIMRAVVCPPVQESGTGLEISDDGADAPEQVPELADATSEAGDTPDPRLVPQVTAANSANGAVVTEPATPEGGGLRRLRHVLAGAAITGAAASSIAASVRNRGS